MSNAKNFVLLGSSGSGKGTQAKLLVERFGNLHHISTGDLFRNLAAANTFVSERVAGILREGGFPPDDLAEALLINAISFRVRGGEGFVLDGFPRTKPQVGVLDRFLNFLNVKDDTFFVLIDVSRPEAFKRMLERGRSDDSGDSINSRLDLFEKEVMPVVKRYKRENRLILVNGEQNALDVHRGIISKSR